MYLLCYNPICFVLVGGKVKLADFGFASSSKLLSLSKGLATGVESSPYTPPELFQRRDHLESDENLSNPGAPLCTSAFDTYALGFIFWQLWYKSVPWGKEPAHRVPSLVESGMRPAFAGLRASEIHPESMKDRSKASLLPPPSFTRLIEVCWAQNPSDRPDVQQVLKEFGAEVKAELLATENDSTVKTLAVEAAKVFNKKQNEQERAPREAERPVHTEAEIIDALEVMNSEKSSGTECLCAEIDNLQKDGNSPASEKDSNKDSMHSTVELTKQTGVQHDQSPNLGAASDHLSSNTNVAEERVYSEMKVAPRAHASSLFQVDFFVSFDDTHEVAASVASELITTLTQKGYSTSSSSTTPSLASCLIAIVTDNFFKNESCVRELIWATQENAFIQPVVTFADKGSESRLLQQCPINLLDAIVVSSFVCLDLADIYYWKTGCARIISAKTRVDEQRHKSKGSNLWQKCASKILGAKSDQSAQEPISFDFFLSYAAGPGSEIAAKLVSDLEARGKKCCLSHSVRAESESATQKALAQSACVLAIISDHNTKLHLAKSPILTSSEKALQSFIHREDCMDELLWAAESGIAVQPVVSMKDKERMIDLLDNRNGKVLEFLGTSNYVTMDFNDALEWKHGLVKILLARDEIARKHEEGRTATTIHAKESQR